MKLMVLVLLMPLLVVQKNLVVNCVNRALK